MTETTLNIYQKLIEVRKSCEYLKKDNKGYQFQFVSSSQTLGTLRAAMDEQQLLLVPKVTAHETRDHTTKKGDHEYFTIATMSFTWINADNPEEKLECPWLGHGLDSGEKGVGKAMTYAEKYFLLKFFNIATDKDDPDSFQKQKKITPPPSAQGESTPETNRRLSQDDATKKTNGDFWAVIDALKTSGEILQWEAANKQHTDKVLNPLERGKLKQHISQMVDLRNSEEK